MIPSQNDGVHRCTQIFVGPCSTVDICSEPCDNCCDPGVTDDRSRKQLMISQQFSPTKETTQDWCCQTVWLRMLHRWNQRSCRCIFQQHWSRSGDCYLWLRLSFFLSLIVVLTADGEICHEWHPRISPQIASDWPKKPSALSWGISHAVLHAFYS